MLVDTHAHVNFPDFAEDREEIMARAYSEGVKKILHSCCRIREIPELLDLSREFNGNNSLANLFIALGVHPIEVSSWEDSSGEQLNQILVEETKKDDHKIRAIGETGLDYFHCTEQEEQKKQREIFQEQINLAQTYKLPLIIHTRDAWEDTLAILTENFKNTKRDRNGTIHCYTGDLEFAEACIDLGFYISWSGIVTFKKTENLREVASKLPLEKTLVETDCPYLAPQAKRGKRNEPSYVKYVAECLSEVYGKDLSEIMQVTTKNAEYLFNL